ncbi:MAG TPA: helix-turn-helix transcriptional regulator [Candidatus Limnocylindrales bacterium]|nr:helix-turn-helix transcriptional regulator [Candidatus Limnocylindrales bacterium]
MALTATRNARAIRQRLREDLERLCQGAGISQRALALASGVPQSYLSEIFSGSARPTVETYGRLSSALGADLSARIYPNTGPAIRDRRSVPILEVLLADLHPRWRAFPEVRVVRPGRGWIDVALYEEREAVIVAGEIESTMNRIEQLVRWSGEKADSLPSWEGWSRLPAAPSVSRFLVLRWTRSTRRAAREADRQLRLAYPAHPADALAALRGSTAWPGAAIIWARAEGTKVRLVGTR